MPRFLPATVVIVLISLLAGCSETETRTSSGYQTLRTQISQYQSNPDKIDFLAFEAAQAGVKRFRIVKSTQVYGRSNSNGTIELSSALRGGTGVINMTHEIAHVAGFRKNCVGHKKCWIQIYLDIARRYEERFPGEKWSGTTPTRRVMRNVGRYGIRM